jgi:hypothetical protein
MARERCTTEQINLALDDDGSEFTLDIARISEVVPLAAGRKMGRFILNAFVPLLSFGSLFPCQPQNSVKQVETST